MKVDILEQTRKNIFSVPIFEFEVDLKFINIPDEGYRPTWESGINSTYGQKGKIPKETMKYLREKVISCLKQLEDPVDYIDIVDVWKNYYLITDYQGYHTHSNTMWSFIINHSVEETKTQFFNPYIADIQNQTPLHNSKDMPTIYMPKLKRGQMILFPSWVAHQVLAGNTGITISGNVKCTTQRHHRI